MAIYRSPHDNNGLSINMSSGINIDYFNQLQIRARELTIQSLNINGTLNYIIPIEEQFAKNITKEQEQLLINLTKYEEKRKHIESLPKIEYISI